MHYRLRRHRLSSPGLLRRGAGLTRGQELVFGPNIADWPEQMALPENLLLTVCSAIYDPVTTTDELIPSGETSSYRSNPLKLCRVRPQSRKDPQLCAPGQGGAGGGDGSAAAATLQRSPGGGGRC
ncbi:MAG: hypothetical protein ACLRWQ_06865 [Flavonifractor plautii]